MSGGAALVRARVGRRGRGLDDVGVHGVRIDLDGHRHRAQPEPREQRAGLLQTLANLPAHPDSVPINRLVQVEGTPLNGTAQLDPFEFVRTVAVARILMPKSMVRLSAGRETMSDELQALCFLAGANSIFYGEKLLTTGNPDTERDMALFARLGLKPMPVVEQGETVHADILVETNLDTAAGAASACSQPSCAT